MTKLKFILLTIGLIFSIHGFGKIHEENERITIDFFGKIYKLDIKKDPINSGLIALINSFDRRIKAGV